MMVIGGLFIYLGGGEIKLCEWIAACMNSIYVLALRPGWVFWTIEQYRLGLL